MSVRQTAWLLFVVALATVPFPLLGIDGSTIPAARFFQLAGVLAALIAKEGAGGMVGLIALLLLVHALVWTGVLAMGTWGTARLLLSRVSPGVRAGLAVLLCGVALGVSSVTSLYDTQFHHNSAHARLWDLYR